MMMALSSKGVFFSILARAVTKAEELTKLFKEQYKNMVEFCYLFGSYAKGYATERSDVDLSKK